MNWKKKKCQWQNHANCHAYLKNFCIWKSSIAVFTDWNLFGSRSSFGGACFGRFFCCGWCRCICRGQFTGWFGGDSVGWNSWNWIAGWFRLCWHICRIGFEKWHTFHHPHNDRFASLGRVSWWCDTFSQFLRRLHGRWWFDLRLDITNWRRIWFYMSICHLHVSLRRYRRVFWYCFWRWTLLYLDFNIIFSISVIIVVVVVIVIVIDSILIVIFIVNNLHTIQRIDEAWIRHFVFIKITFEMKCFYRRFRFQQYGPQFGLLFFCFDAGPVVRVDFTQAYVTNAI